MFNRVTGKNLTPKTLLRTVLNEKKEEVTESYNILMDGDKPYTSFDRTELTKEDLIEAGISNIDAAGVYPNITAALGDLNLRGVSSAVTLLLLDTLYSSETFPLVANIPTTTSTNNVTIKPSSGVNSVISGSVSGITLFKIIGTSNITIDGSNNGSNTMNLSFNNAGTVGRTIGIGSIGTNPVSNITIKNCLIINNSSNNNAWGIAVCDSSALGSTSAGQSGVPGYFSDITIQNNNIQKTYTGIMLNGGTSSQNGSNVSILNNVMNGNDANTKIFNTGIYLQGINGATISDNELGNITTTNTGTSNDVRSIWVSQGMINTIIDKNLIYNIGYTGASAGGSGKGIVISSGETSSNILVKNNMIYKIIGTANTFVSTAALNSPTGIYILGGTSQTGIKIFNNSINLFGNTISTNQNCFSYGIAMDDSTSADIRNNIISNSLGTSGSSVFSGAIGIFAEYPASQFTNLDNNIYWINPANGLKLIGKIGTNNYSTIADWRTATSKDLNSYNLDPKFISDSNLHISTSDSTPVESNGVILADVTADFDSEPRYPNPGYPFNLSFMPTAPDIGADETGSIAPLPVELASFNSLVVKNEVILDWITIAEINNASFEIERSMTITPDNYQKVGSIQGNGTTTEIKNYKFSDRNLQTGSYKYRLKQIDYNGNFHYFNLNNEVEVGIPNKYNLSQNYPNPFNPETKIDYDIPKETKVSLKIYDVTGREVANIINNEVHKAGYYTVKFNASVLSSGIYFYRLVAGDFVMSKKMLLVK